ncbi:MAG: hypothetical protein GKS07_10965 [Nitrosopumilus sp.]|nr:MAG: hypothetical protein GKS07_00530 [Nitrosopumilus sp.]QMU55362.1 MAG: hypothetical protein GKS07_10965 [Nitrosopumilus sp.]
MQKLIPGVSVDKFSNFAKSKEVIIAAVSFILTPIAISQAQKLLVNVPFLQNNLTIGLIIVAFFLFLFATKMEGLVKTVGMAIAGEIFVSAVLSFGAVQQTLNKVGLN